MNISVSVQLAEGDTTTQTPEEIAYGVLNAIGDPDKDFCTATIMAAPSTGSAGTMPEPPAPPSAMPSDEEPAME